MKDTLRDESKALVVDLKACGIEPIIFSGDREAVVRQVSGELGINDYRAEMGSGEKQAEIDVLQQQGRTVLMIGDGINDAQALAAARFWPCRILRADPRQNERGWGLYGS